MLRELIDERHNGQYGQREPEPPPTRLREIFTEEALWRGQMRLFQYGVHPALRGQDGSAVVTVYLLRDERSEKLNRWTVAEYPQTADPSIQEISAQIQEKKAAYDREADERAVREMHKRTKQIARDKEYDRARGIAPSSSSTTPAPPPSRYTTRTGTPISGLALPKNPNQKR
jgi:hypothetical protein